MLKLSKNYKKYNLGGYVAGFTGETVDALSPYDRFGRRAVGSSALAGAGKGAAAGAALGPLGIAAGALIGGTVGVLGQQKANREGDAMVAREQLNTRIQDESNAAANLAADPTLMTGRLSTGYYANGGYLESMSKESQEVKGASHSQGGVQLPEYNAEVEGGETIKDGYVFSKQLGFADLHRPIAKSIGKIEAKVMSPERVNSLKFLSDQEQKLKLSQEYVKAKLHLN
jgi:hypothetical protein